MTAIEFFNTRASVRNFDPDKHVSDAALDSMLGAATHAPSTGNMQLYSVIVTRDAERRKAIEKLHYNQPAAVGADVLLTFCADVSRFDQWCRQRHAESGLNNAGGKITAIIDATIFAQQFVTIAEQQGLGCCYLGTVTYNLDGFIKALELPKGVIPLFTVAVGYPAAIGAPSDRLPLQAIVHREKYNTPSAAAIDSYYAEKEQLEESHKFIAENNLTTLAQVYAHVRYPRELNESLGDDMMRLLAE